jgi:S1-C subfamily serine protease
MKKQLIGLSSVLLISVLFLSACSGVSGALSNITSKVDIALAAQGTPTQPASNASKGTTSSSASSSTGSSTAVSPAGTSGTDILAAYESALENVYAAVSPQVVNITVLSPATSSDFQNVPGFNNTTPQSQAPQYNRALGSGFVWDTNGNIVTNNHVVEGATKIDVTFSDGTTVPATVVGTDPYSDLAVIKVEVSADKLHPVTVADSTQVKVGEIAIAIGNPYGFEGSMTVGNVSGLGRDLPSSQVDQNSGATYSIPDVIQTDASINPGNSGGVLVNDKGEVIGVTSALESASGSSSGIGFAIPAEIVSKVVPSLISTGTYQHPYLGISGNDMSPDIAHAMNLPADTRGALVQQVAPGGPAEKAGLQPSTTTVTINGSEGTVGGDIITAIDGQTVNSMSDIIAYLAIHTQVGQTVNLTVLRNGQTKTVEVLLGTRPTQ